MDKMDKLLGSLANKAQSAIDNSPLAGHVPGLNNPSRNPQQNPQASHQDSINPNTTYSAADKGPAPAAGSYTGPWLDNLQHSIRSLQVQYTPQSSGEVRQLQLLIHGQKGVSLDFDSVARDSKSHAKELYLWGQDQSEDLKDVTDRLAYFNFASGALATSLAGSLEGTRLPLKALRDAEAALTPRRTARANLAVQIHRLRTEGSKSGATDKRIAELEGQLKKLRADDATSEVALEKLKRKVLRDSEGKKWDAIKEYAEKLLLLSQASERLFDSLPDEAPTAAKPYTGVKRTATVRASLQKALNNYKPGQQIQPLAVEEEGEDDDQTDKKSFGETHKAELERIPSGVPRAGGTPPPQSHPSTSSPHLAAHSPVSSPPPIDPTHLNNSPAPIPQHPTITSSPKVSAVPLVIPEHAAADHPLSAGADSSSSIPTVPTIAETGVPVSAGDRGPGPATGSLSRDGDGAAPHVGKYGESAEEEKIRLEREERERVLHLGATHSDPTPAPPPAAASSTPTATTGASAAHETAEEEKRRLEREERERILRGDNEPGPSHGEGETPPPYTD